MASDTYHNMQSGLSRTESSGSQKHDRQESVYSQQERAIQESMKVLDITGNLENFNIALTSAASKGMRPPRLYHINNNQTILIILQGDITRTKVDAIVNAANEHMTGGGGVDGVIHRAAGDKLYDACKLHKEISRGVRLPTGHSRILLSYDMSDTTYYIINTAGPMYSRYKAEECAKELTSCYKTALALANLYDLNSIGFTAISCGIFGYPVNDGADVALQTVNEFADALPVVVFVLWDNHIYDAWIRKAQELKFSPYKSESTKPLSSQKSSNNDNEEKPIDNPVANDDHEKSSFKPTSPADDELTKPESENKTEASMTETAPILSESSDTQKAEEMDQDDNSNSNKQPLTSHNTTAMENVNLGKEESTPEDSSQPESDQKTIKESITGDSSQPEPDRDTIKESDDKRAKLDTTEDEPQSIAVETNPNDNKTE